MLVVWVKVTALVLETIKKSATVRGKRRKRKPSAKDRWVEKVEKGKVRGCGGGVGGVRQAIFTFKCRRRLTKDIARG